MIAALRVNQRPVSSRFEVAARRARGVSRPSMRAAERRQWPPVRDRE
jgi:hypothetical protein